MEIYHKKEDFIPLIKIFKSQNKNIGFVPTMGALHEGHLSLIKKGLLQNDVMVVSIFVNPTQFNNKEDLKNYPRTLNRDIELLKTLSETILVFAPTTQDIYGSHITATHFEYDGLEHQMEGKFRPGHFDGVGTIVKRLLEIVQPDNA